MKTYRIYYFISPFKSVLQHKVNARAYFFKNIKITIFDGHPTDTGVDR